MDSGYLTLSMLAVAALAAAAPAPASTTQDLGAVVVAAEAAVTARGPGVRARAEPPDTRLRLAECGRPLDATSPAAAKGPRIPVRVSCAGAAPWSLLVTVAVETETEVVVARRALLPGTVLGADDLALSIRRIPGFADCCAGKTAALLGQRVRRPIPADAAVPLDSLETAPMVRRGEMVTVVAGAPGFEVRSSGIAMGDARQGDVVRVRHATSLRIIQARADSRGVVRADR